MEKRKINNRINRKKLVALIGLFLISSTQTQCTNKQYLDKAVKVVKDHPYLVAGTAVVVGIAGYVRYKQLQRNKSHRNKLKEFFGIETKNEKGGQWGKFLAVVGSAIACYLAYSYGASLQKIKGYLVKSIMPKYIANFSPTKKKPNRPININSDSDSDNYV